MGPEDTCKSATTIILRGSTEFLFISAASLVTVITKSEKQMPESTGVLTRARKRWHHTIRPATMHLLLTIS
ncbi:hypothetical protein NC651_001576 [Populus alba x Populus x berolinensis]|nr:hypothetical protein NC651_001576 [Populus alba x Populus x berolinensis]